MSYKKYSDQEIDQFLEVAKDIGIGRAIRKVGYPDSWGTANRWAKARGIEVTVDDLKAKSKEYHDWYNTEEALLVAQEGMARVHEMLTEQDLDADSQKKLAEAFQKYANTWLLLQGKANAISESRTKDSTDIELLELINEQKMKNAEMESDISDAKGNANI